MRLRGWRVFKAMLYALLLGNVALYAMHGSAAETVDTAAWLALLLLFEWETGGWTLSPRTRHGVHALRAIASLSVLWVWGHYAVDGAWLDFANASTWLGVVLVLETEVRSARTDDRWARLRSTATWLLYAALGGFALAWVIQGLRGVGGALLDAWDATLWLLAFVAIELNVFGMHRPD